MKKIIIGVLVSIVALYFVLRGVNWGTVLNHLGNANIPLLLLSMLAMLAVYALMSWRWRFLLAPISHKKLTFVELYSATMSGYFFNSFLPARAGDVMRAHLVGNKIGVSRTSILATVVIEKLFDGLALLVLLALGLPAVHFAGASEQLGLIALVALALIFGGLILFRLQSERMIKLISAALDFLPIPARIRAVAVRLLHTFAHGLGVFEKPGPLLICAAISLLAWIMGVVMFWTAMSAFNLPPVSLPGLLFLTGLVNLGLLIPAMPGNIGNYEGFVIAGLALLLPGINKDIAVAFALVFHVSQLITTLIVGGLIFLTQHVSLKEISQGSGPDAPDEDAEIAAHAKHTPREEITELGIEKL